MSCATRTSALLLGIPAIALLALAASGAQIDVVADTYHVVDGDDVIDVWPIENGYS